VLQDGGHEVDRLPDAGRSEAASGQVGNDGKIMTGWGSMARTHDDAEAVIAQLNTEHEEISAP
jgi:hypothetical protein